MYQPGDVVLIDFPGVQGYKVRPGIVVSTAQYQGARPDIVVAVCSTQIRKANSPFDFLLQDWQLAGLHQPTAFRSFFSTLPASSVIHQIGALTTRDWQEVQSRLRIALAVT